MLCKNCWFATETSNDWLPQDLPHN